MQDNTNMRRRDFVTGLAYQATSRQAPPNILFIMPDQWRGMDLGIAGNPQVRTPNLDQLARDGVFFRSAVANCPVCTPARSMLLTGRYPHTTGTAVNDVPLPESTPAIAKTLQANHYYTGFVGKWHLAGGKRLPGFVPPGPRRQGFEFWAANICDHRYFQQTYFRDDPSPIPMRGYDLFTWTNLACEFLDRAQQKKQPFCLYFQPPTPHDPYLPPPGFEQMYRPEDIQLRPNWQAGATRFGTAKEIAGYYAAIACLDQQIGRLLAKLDAIGQRENTIVIFTSDHGDMLGSHHTYLKRKPWEESVRVPGVVRWPAAIRPRVSDAPFSHVDVVPTLLGLAGIRPPGNLHGFDYSAYLRGKFKQVPEFAHLMIYTNTEGDEHPPWRGLRSTRYKYARFAHERWLLYDLEQDPYEMGNLAHEPAMRKLADRFDKVIAKQMERTADRWTELHDQPYT